tara:strand:+ start:2272 stop:3105 length:834 start_codon:yes stop_codon:yes gene_type:complete
MRSLLIILLCLINIHCSNSENTYRVKGTIREINRTSNEIIIAHDTISGLMMPMIMPFNIKNKKEVESLSIGDSVHFEFIWGERSTYAKGFEVVGRGHLPVEDDSFFEDEYSIKKVGDILDDVTLLDLDSLNFQLSNFDGRYRFISFIFTRCPMPNMCPAVVIKTNYLSESFSEKNNIDFILVSFDYRHDTPSVLKKFYGVNLSQKENIHILSSVGYIEDVYRLTKQSGGDFWGIDKGQIGHKLTSILVGPNRKVLASWEGDKWRPGQVENAIRLLIK